MPNRPARAVLPLLLSLISLPVAAVVETPGESVVTNITLKIEERDCTEAVEWLKYGLKQEYREVALMAGTMYDHGICVRRDWARAVGFYTQAHAAGMARGAERLAAGYADPANGPDVAAALWWASKTRSFRDPACRIAKEAVNDPDRFVAELSAWKPERLAYCNYTAGVIMTIASELRYPDMAAAYSMGGKLTLRFLPGVPRIELQKNDSQEFAMVGLINGNWKRDRDSKEIAGSIEKAVTQLGDRALKRYPQPQGIPADSVIELNYTFEVLYK
ncbi:sel1 repeat family protein [Massilia sp. ZL223]|uniref:sel1 repeat family protein n=1 Tax=Massilia sp. ZL223 TaxID=2824904 RepID=UPI001B823994|nr:sel1 repeat family protein [Massilia sp. ZL223]MBQ5963748.1 sel1 repeat family protein [Massilia sp. ZL223]